ncbi:hypothetical protein BH10BAC3_BH10BAC3_31440 [soil metagenome]
MRELSATVFASFLCVASFAQTVNGDSAVILVQMQKDSTLRATMHADSAKIDKEFADKLKEAHLKGIAVYPALKGGDMSGVIPVKDPTEIPDPNMDYKLLFELTSNNPDPAAKEINYGLTEVSRIINLHVASGIPLKRIIPVIVVHAGALNAFATNVFYKEKYKTDNPNQKLINDLSAIGTRFIACGQAMVFFDVKKEVLLPIMKVSLTAQTVISSYQLKGYVKYW